MSMEDRLALSILLATFSVVFPTAGIATGLRFVPHGIFLSLLGLGLSLLPIGIMKYYNVHFPNIALLSYASIAIFAFFLLLNLLFLWLNKDD